MIASVSIHILYACCIYPISYTYNSPTDVKKKGPDSGFPFKKRHPDSHIFWGQGPSGYLQRKCPMPRDFTQDEESGESGRSESSELLRSREVGFGGNTNKGFKIDVGS